MGNNLGKKLGNNLGFKRLTGLYITGALVPLSVYMCVCTCAGVKLHLSCTVRLGNCLYILVYLSHEVLPFSCTLECVV